MSQPPGYPPQPPGGVPPQPPGGAYPPPGAPPGGGYPPPGAPPGGGYPPQGPSPYGPPGGGAPPPQAFRLQKRNTVLIVGLAVAAVAVLGLLAWALLGGRGGEPAAAGEPGAPPAGPAPTGTFQPTPVGTPPPAPPPPGESPAPTPPASEPAPQPEPTGGPAGPGAPVEGGTTIALGDDVALIPVPDGWQAQHVVDDQTQAAMGDGQGHFVWAGLFNADPAQSAAELIAENRDALLNSEIYSQLETGEVQAVQPTGSLVSLAQVTYSGLVTDNQASAQVAGLLVLGVRQDGFVLALTGDIAPAQDPTSQEFIDDFGATIAPILNGAYANFGGTGQ